MFGIYILYGRNDVIFIKCIILFTIFLISSFLGIAFANKYKERVNDLRKVRSALNILKTKIEYTYEPLPQIFSEISDEFNDSIGDIFKTAGLKMQELSAGESWKYAIKSSKTNMKEEDLRVLENLEKLLGKTNIEGQLSEIELIEKFIIDQSKIAEDEQKKNEKMYKSLGIIAGLAIAIILI